MFVLSRSKIQDCAENGRRVASSGKTLQFFVCFNCFLLFYVLDVVSITVYDRDTLLNIGSSVVQRKPDFEFLNAGGQTRHLSPLSGSCDQGNAADAEKEEKELAFSSD